MLRNQKKKKRSGEIEDESHFVVAIDSFYDDLREKFNLMKEGIQFGEERKTEAGKKRLMQLLLGTGLQRQGGGGGGFAGAPRGWGWVVSRPVWFEATGGSGWCEE